MSKFKPGDYVKIGSTDNLDTHIGCVGKIYSKRHIVGDDSLVFHRIDIVIHNDYCALKNSNTGTFIGTRLTQLSKEQLELIKAIYS